MDWSAVLTSRFRALGVSRPSQLFFFTCVCLLTIQPSSVKTQNLSGNSNEMMSDEMFRVVWSGYQQAVRPLCGLYPATTKVTVGIGLRQIQELDEPKQILTTNIWLRVAWSDCRLKWNTTQWNVSRLVVPYSVIWSPDLTLYDNAESKLSGVQSHRIAITSEGSVRQQVPVVLRSVCQLDVSRFPFDTQTCNLTFGSWAYNGHELNLSEAAEAVDLKSYITHGEWHVASLTSQRIEPVFSGVPYPQVIFTLVLQRRHLFYTLSLLFPCALIQMMAALSFLLPCETNEKVGLEITVLLSLAVMQLVILGMIPASSETLPLIGVYFLLAMIVVSLSCLMTITVLAVHYPNRHRPLPPWSRAILDWKVARWLGVDVSTIQKHAKTPDGGSFTDPYLTGQTTGHPAPKTENTSRVHDGDIEMSSVVALEDYPAPIAHNTTTNTMSDPLDISSDTAVSFYYSIEGDRSKRVCYRPQSADASQLAQLAYPLLQQQQQQPSELQEVVRLCRSILVCMKAGKKHTDAHEKSSNKAARREWELMAVFLDRVFLLVFCLLTCAMFGYIYGSIV